MKNTGLSLSLYLNKTVLSKVMVPLQAAIKETVILPFHFLVSDVCTQRRSNQQSGSKASVFVSELLHYFFFKMDKN